MLQSMRDKAKSWVTFVVVGIIAFMMAITGLETLAPNPNNPEVASVNGKDITRAELAQAVDQQRRVLIQQMGGQFDLSMLDDQLLQSSVLEAMIDRQLLLQNAEDQKMDIGQSQIDKLILAMPQFQQDGHFDADRFHMMVRSYGMTPLQFRNAIREETLLLQLRSGVANTEFVTVEELKRLQSLEGQTRDLAWVILSADEVRKAISPSDEEIKAYYDANAARFMTPEQVVVDYVVLDKSAIAKSVAVTDEAIEAEYQYRIAQLQQSENNPVVSVILIQTGEQRTLEDAKARANEVMAKLESGSSFAELAKTYSDDAVTATKGGDLGAVEPGFFGDDFDNIVAELAVGEVSEPIETEFGLQILQVTARDEAVVPTLSEMRADIAAALKQNEVDALFLEQSRQLVDISFEASDLTQPAEQLGLTIMTSEAFGRQGADSGIATDSRIPAAAFSDDVLNLGANSELIEITPDQAVVLRVREHKKPELMPLADVTGAIVTTLKDRSAEEQLAERAGEIVAELQSGTSLASLAGEQKLDLVESGKTGRNKPEVPVQLLQEAFKMPHPGNNSASYDSVRLPDGDYAVIALSAIYPGEATTSSEQLQGLGQFIAASDGRAMFDEYLASLKERGEVKIVVDNE